jgi:hypothetical protein
MKKRIIVIFVFIFFYLSQYGQAVQNEDKIDPFLRQFLFEQNEKNKKKRSSKIKVSGAGNNQSKNETSSKKFECIIYTKNAKALKERDIMINSILPTFVTAVLSLEQVKQLSLMNEVTYIEAAKNSYPNH